jgi:hypothetical protein
MSVPGVASGGTARIARMRGPTTSEGGAPRSGLQAPVPNATAAVIRM